MTEEKQEQKSRKGLILWSIIIMLMISNAVTLWLWNTSQNEIVREKVVTKEVMVERENLQEDLLALKTDYDGLQTNNKVMQADIDAKKMRIEELIEEAKKHKGDASIIKKLREETQTLRQIMIGYVHTIDSLNTLNQHLVIEKKTVLKQLDVEKEKQVTLNKEKDQLKSTIAKGSILTCFNVTAQAVSYKRGGKKESETTKAKRTEKVKVGFTLGENKIARAGEKTVYIRIMTPDGKEMAKSYDDNYKFTFNQSNGYFAGKEVLNYANKDIMGVTYCEGQGEFVPGTYLVEITCDGVVIGNTSFKLD
jgi:hypothetical protein